jgi:hypothetical protein
MNARFREGPFMYAPKFEPLPNLRQDCRMNIKHHESFAVQEVPSIQ